MKLIPKKVSFYCIFYVFFYTTSMKAEGFFPNPLIKTYCISQHIIVAHNAIPVIVISIPAIVSTIVPVVKTCLFAGATFFGIHLAKKSHTTRKTENIDTYSSSSSYAHYYPNPNDPHDDENKKKNNNHPHGIYKDAPYHHKNSKIGKSPAPDNGQHCLDYSIGVGKQRVAIEGNEFVILRRTCPGEYHGFKVAWKELDDTLRTALIKHGFVKKSGKIIRQITEKFLS